MPKLLKKAQNHMILYLLYIELAISFLIGRKRTVNFRNQRLWRHHCRLYNNHVKVTSNDVKVTGNHVMYDRGAWFLRVIMSSSRALCCLALAKERKNDFNFFRSIQCIIKQLLDSVSFCDIQNNRGLGKGYQLSLRLRLITPTSTSIILDITKTSSNNCLKSGCS